MVVALTAGANAASQMRRVAQDGYGSFSTEASPASRSCYVGSAIKIEAPRGTVQ